MLLASPSGTSVAEIASPLDPDATAPSSASFVSTEAVLSSATASEVRPVRAALYWVALYRMMVHAEATTDGRPRLSFPVMYYRSIQSGPTHDGGTNLPDAPPWIDEKNIIVRQYGSLASYQTSGAVDKLGRTARYALTSASIRGRLVEAIPAADDAASSPWCGAIRWIKKRTGLSEQRIAALFGVVRQTLYLWQCGGSMSDANRRRVLAVRDVLERASRRYATPEQLRGWLDTPRGADARTPAQLLEVGEIDRARYFAVSTAGGKLRPSPPWAENPVREEFRRMREREQVAFPLTENATDPAAEADDNLRRE